MPANIMTMYRSCFIPIFGALVLTGAALLYPPMASAQQILINELSDIDFGRVLPTGGQLQADIRFCVVLDQNTTYQVLASGEEVGGDFVLRSGPYRLPYQVRYTDRKRPGGFRQLFPGQPLTGLKTRGNNSGICRRPNAGLRIALPANELRRAASGNYRSTLTLMVSPE